MTALSVVLIAAFVWAECFDCIGFRTLLRRARRYRLRRLHRELHDDCMSFLGPCNRCERVLRKLDRSKR